MRYLRIVLVLIAAVATILFSFCIGLYFGESNERLAHSMYTNTSNSPLEVDGRGAAFGDESAGWQKLKDIVIPGMHFEELTLKEAMFAISAESVDYDPEGKGVHICLGMVGRNIMNTNKVSFHGTNVKLGVIINDIANSVDAEYVIRPSILFQWVEK